MSLSYFSSRYTLQLSQRVVLWVYATLLFLLLSVGCTELNRSNYYTGLFCCCCCCLLTFFNNMWVRERARNELHVVLPHRLFPRQNTLSVIRILILIETISTCNHHVHTPTAPLFLYYTHLIHSSLTLYPLLPPFSRLFHSTFHTPRNASPKYKLATISYTCRAYQECIYQIIGKININL